MDGVMTRSESPSRHSRRETARDRYLNTPELPPEWAVLVAQLFQALADPTRARILYVLTKQEHTVGDLARIAGISASATSHQLKHLRDLRMVKTRRTGNRVYYAIVDTHVAALFTEALHHVAHMIYNLPDHPSETEGEESTHDTDASVT
jgi:DNA-binding transcriptional ArsR family regulator